VGQAAQEDQMFVRKVSVRLKADSLKQFTNHMESQVLPWLRTQEGFQGLILLASTDGREIAALSFWDHKSDVGNYDSQLYPRVLKTLQELLDGIPYVKTFEVVSSTFRWGAIVLPKEENMIREIGLAQCGYRSCDTDV
jgi:heme-degrading monooxygenase HmoA